MVEGLVVIIATQFSLLMIAIVTSNKTRANKRLRLQMDKCYSTLHVVHEGIIIVSGLRWLRPYTKNLMLKYCSESAAQLIKKVPQTQAAS